MWTKNPKKTSLMFYLDDKMLIKCVSGFSTHVASSPAAFLLVGRYLYVTAAVTS